MEVKDSTGRCPGAMWHQLHGAAAGALRRVAFSAESGGGGGDPRARLGGGVGEDFFDGLPSGYVKIAIENHHL